MAAALVTQGAERIALGCRKTVEHPVYGVPEAESTSLVFVHRRLIAHRHATHIFIPLVGAIPHPIGLDIGQILHAIMLNDV